MADFGQVGHIISGQVPFQTDCQFMVIAGLPDGPDRQVVVLSGRGFIGYRSVLPGEIGVVDMTSEEITWWLDSES